MFKKTMVRGLLAAALGRATFMLAVPALLLGGMGQVQADTITYSGAVVEFTVDTTGTYQITAAGGQGGGNVYSLSNIPGTGGPGELIGGDISLTAGTQLAIVAGGAGQTGSNAGGGGGGTFVYVVGADPTPHRSRRRRRFRLL